MKFFLYCGIISKGVTMKTEIIIKSREEMIKQRKAHEAAFEQKLT